MAKLDTFFSAVIAVAAASMAATYAYKTFRQPASALPDRRAAETRLTRVAEPGGIAKTGVRVGPEQAKVEVAEFSDLQCPYCKTSHEAVRLLMRDHPGDVAYTFVHYPLPTHAFALPAARAAECARIQGSFIDVVDRLFEQQDSLGAKSWTRFASEGRVADTVQFARCLESQVQAPAIRDGMALGKRWNVRATPTVVVNGWRFETAPTPDELKRVVELILSGRSPLNSTGNAVVVKADDE